MQNHQHALPHAALPGAATRFSFRVVLRSLFERFLALYGVYQERRTLEEMPEHLLRDIGLTREAARREAMRPFWDNPRA